MISSVFFVYNVLVYYKSKVQINHYRDFSSSQGNTKDTKESLIIIEYILTTSY